MYSHNDAVVKAVAITPSASLVAVARRNGRIALHGLPQRKPPTIIVSDAAAEIGSSTNQKHKHKRIRRLTFSVYGVQARTPQRGRR
ncbi:hypothetical protein PYCC9005_004312 [Savitreella phatthalungensis]